MVIENNFTVGAAPDDVFALMVDVERVAPCLPGTEILGPREGGGFDGQMKIKLGPMKMSYKGSVEISEQDATARTAVMIAKGVEARGQGTAQGRIAMSVEPFEGGSAVSITTDIKLTGRVAQMGQGIMRDVSTNMVNEMAKNMEAAVGTPPAIDGTVADSPTQAPEFSGSAAESTAVPPPKPAGQLNASAVIAAIIRGRIAAFRAWVRRSRA